MPVTTDKNKNAEGQNDPPDALACDARGASSVEPTPESNAGATERAPATGSPIRWWVAVAAGCAVALPLGWLLSYAAALPFLIGTFFFALLGLIIGAVTFRVARRGAPYSRRAVLIGTTIIVLIGWGYSIHVEAKDLPAELAAAAVSRTRNLGDRTPEAFEAEVAERIRAYLNDRYPPGGVLGYVRWVVAEGRIPRGQAPPAAHTLSVNQRGLTWVIRAVLSLGLLAFGVASQTFSLSAGSVRR